MVHDSEASRSLDNGAAGTASTPGWPESTIAEADSQVGAAARAIRLYYFRQLSVLRQIPYLALEANGRGGWLDNYYRAYRECLYPMHQEHETWGAYDLFIELRSGVLLGASTTPSEYVITLEQTFRLGGESSVGMASDEEIYVKLAHQSAEDRFNPKEFVRFLEHSCKEPYHNDVDKVETALRQKADDKVHLDGLMDQVPLNGVLHTLRQQGFEV